MKKITIFIYGVISYAITMATFAYFAGFLGNFLVPKGIDATPEMPLIPALAINLGLITLFGLQHSIMARPAFKKAFTKIIPEAAERSTYCLISSVLMLLMFWQWQPLGGIIWNIQSETAKIVLYSIYGGGWALLVFVTFLINHFDLFGLRQVYLNLRGKPYKPLGFVTPLFYKYMRHPLYIGWFLIFWATPVMTVAHFIFAAATTAYILVAVRIEERDLVKAHGQTYETYREQVPMFVPKLNNTPVEEALN